MSDAAPGYVVYGDLAARDALVLTLALAAKRLPFRRIEETASLAYALESRSGGSDPPYLRTPEGFVLSGLHGMLEWLERVHPRPALLPGTPVRRTCARLLEDWIELWLPFRPAPSRATLETIETHLAETGFLLGRTPSRPDLLLAAWLASDVLARSDGRRRLAHHLPHLVELGDSLLAELSAGGVDAAAARDDAVPISLLPLLREIGRGYHAYLAVNQRALKDGAEGVPLDLGSGERVLPVRRESEVRRLEVARELSELDPEARRAVSRVLEPVGAWHALRLPAAIEPPDPTDPRAL